MTERTGRPKNPSEKSPEKSHPCRKLSGRGEIVKIRLLGRHLYILQDFQGNLRARLGIGQRVVVVFEFEAAGGGDGVQLMVGQAAAEGAARGPTGAVEGITGPGHAVQFEDGPQAAFVEGRVVGHERQPLDTGFDIAPLRREIGGISRIFIAQTVDGRREMAVKIGTGTDQAVKRIDHLAAAHDDEDAAVWDAVGQLPEQQRTAVHLHYVEGYSTDEAAALVGCRPSTARTRLHRARKHLKEHPNAFFLQGCPPGEGSLYMSVLRKEAMTGKPEQMHWIRERMEIDAPAWRSYVEKVLWIRR